MILFLQFMKKIKFFNRSGNYHYAPLPAISPYSSINKNSKNKYVHHLHELLGFKLINKNDNRYNYVYNLNDALKEKNNESQPRHYIKICK